MKQPEKPEKTKKTVNQGVKDQKKHVARSGRESGWWEMVRSRDIGKQVILGAGIQWGELRDIKKIP